MSAQERLRNIDGLSYDLKTEEMITAQLVKTYLSGLSEEESLEIMQGGDGRNDTPSGGRRSRGRRSNSG